MQNGGGRGVDGGGREKRWGFFGVKPFLVMKRDSTGMKNGGKKQKKCSSPHVTLSKGGRAGEATTIRRGRRPHFFPGLPRPLQERNKQNGRIAGVLKSRK